MLTARCACVWPPVAEQLDISVQEMKCIGNCTQKVKAFQMQAAKVLMEQDQKKKEENMKQMQQQQMQVRR